MKRSSLIVSFIILLSCISNSQWLKQTNGLPSVFSCNCIDAVGNFAIASAAWIDSVGHPHIMPFKTTDFGDHWNPIEYPLLEVGIHDISIIDDYHYWIATNENKILATSDG